MDPEIGGGLGEARRQRIAVHEVHAAPVPGQVDEVLGEAAAHVHERLRGARDIHEMIEIGAGGDAHPEERNLRQRRTQFVDQRPELPSIERCRANGAPAQGRTGQIAVHVRNFIAVDELQRGVPLVEVDHVRRRFEKGLDPVRVVVVAGLGPKISSDLLLVLHDARATAPADCAVSTSSRPTRRWFRRTPAPSRSR